MATKLANLPNGVRADRSSANLQSLPPVTQSQAAEMLNVSPRNVAIARAIEGEIKAQRQGNNQYTQKEDGQNFAHAKSAQIAAQQSGLVDKETYRQAKAIISTRKKNLRKNLRKILRKLKAKNQPK